MPIFTVECTSSDSLCKVMNWYSAYRATLYANIHSWMHIERLSVQMYIFMHIERLSMQKPTVRIRRMERLSTPIRIHWSKGLCGCAAMSHRKGATIFWGSNFRDMNEYAGELSSLCYRGPIDLHREQAMQTIPAMVFPSVWPWQSVYESSLEKVTVAGVLRKLMLASIPYLRTFAKGCTERRKTTKYRNAQKL